MDDAYQTGIRFIMSWKTMIGEDKKKDLLKVLLLIITGIASAEY